MQGNVQKKKDEIDLWELNEPKRQRQSGNRARAEYQTRTSDSRRRNAASGSRQNESIQIIGQDGPERTSRRSRSVQIIGQPDEEFDRPRQRRRPERPDRQAQRRRSEYSDREMPRRRSVQPDRDMQRRRPVQSDREMQRQRNRSAQAMKRRKAQKRRALISRVFVFGMTIGCFVLAVALVNMVYKTVMEWKEEDIVPVVNTPIEEEQEATGIIAPKITTDLLEINDYSRPGTPLNEVNSIFVHYTANPGTSAAQNRSYFANLSLTHERSASAHYIIGYEGEIIQCIPANEQAYAVMTRNEDSLSIECCYLEKDGEFTQETYKSLVHMLAWLLEEYNLESEDILRHYDCGGKRCPLYYVEHEDAWEQLLADVEAYREQAKKTE